MYVDINMFNINQYVDTTPSFKCKCTGDVFDIATSHGL